LGSSNRSGENNGVNSAWYLILEAIDEAFGVEGFKILGTSAIKKEKEKNIYLKRKTYFEIPYSVATKELGKQTSMLLFFIKKKKNT
jgi:hypothetical protein